MKKVGIFGSCLAGMTAVMLAGDYGCTRVNNVVVNRSDLFLKYFVKRGTIPSREMIEIILSVKCDYAKDASSSLDNLLKETAGVADLPPGAKPLMYNLEHEQFDLFVLDNLHDTHQHKHIYTSLDGKLDFEVNFPFHWCQHSASMSGQFQLLPRLEPIESAQNWVQIVSYLQMVQPAARIVFICAPSCTIVRDEDRRVRADAFEAEFRKAADGIDIDIIPKIHVPVELSKLPDDQDHFDMKVYRALAGRVFTSSLRAPPGR